MKILKQVGILFALCWVSQILEQWIPVPIPASVIALVLMLTCLITRVIRVHHIQEKADFLLANMAFFFVPAGVSVMNYFDILQSSGVKILIVCLVSTVITFAVTAWSVQLTVRLMNRRKKQ